jgi:hypothetical protein
MKQALLILVVGLMAVSASMAQVADPSSAGAPMMMQQRIIVDDKPLFTPLFTPVVPPPTTVSGGYFDNKLQAMRFYVPATYGTFAVVQAGERFTLPTPDGFIDSMYVLLYSLPLGAMQFEVYDDALRQRASYNPTLFHYPDYWTGLPAILDTAQVNAGRADSTHFIKVSFNHKLVGKDFHIVGRSKNYGGITTSLFSLISDSKVGDTTDLEPESSRATILVLYNNNYYPMQMHGFFQNNMGVGLAPDWYIVVFAQVDLAAGGTQTVAMSYGPGLDQNYPNPVSSASGQTVIPFKMEKAGFVTLQVCDAVGRVVKTLANESVCAGSHLRVLDTKGMAPGMYSYRLISAGHEVTRSMLVVK